MFVEKERAAKAEVQMDSCVFFLLFQRIFELRNNTCQIFCIRRKCLVGHKFGMNFERESFKLYADRDCNQNEIRNRTCEFNT